MTENHHPAIISKEQQDRVIKILSQNRRGWLTTGKTYQRTHVNIFVGLLTCGECGGLMTGRADRSRADGWTPSIYMCQNRRSVDKCMNKYISDATLGPFFLNFVANLIKASNSFGKATTIETFEKKLLRGEPFADIDHIERAGLEEL